jgi:hypothetical protein
MLQPIQIVLFLLFGKKKRVGLGFLKGDLGGGRGRPGVVGGWGVGCVKEK